jgi:hypothetical protein
MHFTYVLCIDFCTEWKVCRYSQCKSRHYDVFIISDCQMAELEVACEVILDENGVDAGPPVPVSHPVADHLQANPVMSELLPLDLAAYSTVQQCILNAIAKGAVSAYLATLARFENFCREKGTPYPDFATEILLAYIVLLVRLKVSFQT